MTNDKKPDLLEVAMREQKMLAEVENGLAKQGLLDPKLLTKTELDAAIAAEKERREAVSKFVEEAQALEDWTGGQGYPKSRFQKALSRLRELGVVT